MAMTLALPAARLARRAGVGTFHHVHRPLTGRASARERLAVEVATRSQAVIFVSQASLTSFVDRYRPGRPVPETWRVVHNGIDLDYFTPPDAPGVQPLPADLDLAGSRVVTVLAALRDFKGIDNAIRAWPAVIARYADARLLLVGSGSEEGTLRTLVARLGLQDTVVFAGMRTDIPDVLRGSEVVVLPSVYGENLPTVLMEAGGCARPVVASDVGGISDIVVDGVTGLLVGPRDHAGIAAAVLRLLDDRALGDRLGRAARQRMEERFAAQVWAANLRTVYEQAIEGKRAGGDA
jgi:glycosyltransferase involved in cell wall biosynthesis